MSTTKPTQNQLFAIICLGIAVVTLAIYWPLTSHPFINFDDDEYIVGNPHVTSGLSWTNVVWAFQSGEAANWHPLTWISHMMDCDLYGLNPGGHHLTNLLFHIANTLLLFLLLKEMTGALWRSACVAALFAWHPLHVESVAWASERKDVLSAFFWMLTLLAYARFADLSKVQSPKSKIFYVLALLLFACGLMSKPMVVTLPFVLLLLDFWPLNRLRLPDFGAGSNFEKCPAQNTAAKSWMRAAIFLVAEKIPFFALAATASAVTFLVQKTAGAFWQSPLPMRMANAALAYVRYLSKLFWPTDLAIVYPYPHHWPILFVIGAALLLITWSALFIFRSKQNPYLIVGWLWFLGTLVPTIGLVQVGAQSMADRYTYISSIGLFILVVWGMNDLFDLRPERKKFLPLAGGAILVGCLAVTSLQLNYWQSSIQLFFHAVSVTTDNYVADNTLGKAFERAGDKKKALFLYSETVHLEPRYPQGQFNLAMSLLEYGKTDDALAHLKIAANLTPQDPDIQYDLGTYFLQHDQLEEAAQRFNIALTDRPEFPEAHNALGSVLSRQSRLDEAIAQFSEALRLKPVFVVAHLNLATTLVKQKKIAEAIPHFAEAVRLKPGDPEAYFNLGLALLDNHQPAEAAAQFSEELRLSPNETKAHFRLAQALSRQHKSSDAIAHYREALRLTPDFPDALNELAWILATDPNSEFRSGTEAVQLAKRACELTQNQQSIFLTTLAAAYAEAGQFKEAIATIQKSNNCAPITGQKNKTDINESLSKLFEGKSPFHETF
jgi:tetratricopeptide (TPR) repeat protein